MGAMLTSVVLSIGYPHNDHGPASRFRHGHWIQRCMFLVGLRQHMALVEHELFLMEPSGGEGAGIHTQLWGQCCV